MVEISIQTVGEERFVRGFNSYIEVVKDFGEVFEQLYTDFQSIEKAQFESEGSRGPSGGWQPLSPSYAKWKSMHAPGMPILVLSGAMKRSLTETTGESAKIIEGERKYAAFGTYNTLAEKHQKGGGNLPQRKVVDLTEEDKIRWGRIIQTWAHDMLERMTTNL